MVDSPDNVKTEGEVAPVGSYWTATLTEPTPREVDFWTSWTKGKKGMVMRRSLRERSLGTKHRYWLKMYRQPIWVLCSGESAFMTQEKLSRGHSTDGEGKATEAVGFCISSSSRENQRGMTSDTRKCSGAFPE